MPRANVTRVDARVVLLSAHPEHEAGAREILEEYLRLPDAWEHRGGVPERLPLQFEREIADLPGQGAPPTGDIVVAELDGSIVAAGHVVGFDAGRCEFKRVYVLPPYRHAGVATRLARVMLDRAASLSYATVLLDVMPERTAAVRLWEAMGFSICPPYREYDVPMQFMTRSLEL
jgi:ribosomal protein S18 acetylase RimI-like enzyme